MATKITVVGKVITIPKTPYLVQTDNAVEHFQFDIDESSVVLADKSFYLLFKTSRNSASMQPLPDVSVDPVTGHVLIDWVPDSEFTAVNGYTDIQLKAMSGQTLIWNTTKATVYVYNELLNTAAAQVNPKTPTLFLYYLHVMQGLRTEVEKIYDTFMNDPTIEVDPNVGTPSAEISVEGTGEDKHYHFSFHNLKGETGGGVADVKVDGTSVVTGDIAEINGMEKVADRVSAFQTTPDDSHYPTEKLVKDSLDAIKFQASVVGTTLKIVSSACYVIGTKLYIGSLA